MSVRRSTWFQGFKVFAVAFGLTGGTCVSSAWAQSSPTPTAAAAWPERALRVVLPFPPGGPSDITMRLAAEKMQAALKQPIVVENKVGASGNVGAADVARAGPDGHTWLWSTDTTVTVNPHIFKSLPFKPEDLVPVTVGVRFGSVLVCNPQLGVKTLSDLIAKAKGPDKLMYASGGAGVPGHLSMELLMSLGGFAMVHVPYKGPAPATQDVIGNQVSCGFLAGPTVLPHVRSGRLVALAVSGSERSPVLPDVPTIEQAGVKGYSADFGLVMWAPKGTPGPILAKMRDAFADALKQPDVVDKLRASDLVVTATSSEQAAAMLAADHKKWGEVARRIKLGVD